jgi:hypothetical protein
LIARNAKSVRSERSWSEQSDLICARTLWIGQIQGGERPWKAKRKKKRMGWRANKQKNRQKTMAMRRWSS